MPTELGFFATISQYDKELSMSLLSSDFDMIVKTPSCMVQVKCFADTQVLCDETDEVTIIFYGHICGDVILSCIVDAYKAQGITFVKSLDGSFAFLLVDKLHDRVVVATDRLCSRKVHIRKKDSLVVVSTVLKYLFTEDLAIDPIGLAWYLSSGVFHNNRTIFKDISVLDRASLSLIHI